MTKNQKNLTQAAAIAAALVALPYLLTFVMGNAYGVTILCIMLVYILAVSGLDILFGYSGQISMGHAAFFVIGAYTTGLLNMYFGTPLWITIPVAAIFSTIMGGLLAYPASKLKFHFLALATIAFGEITFTFLYVSPKGFTRDYLGISAKGISFLNDYTAWYFFLLFWVALALLGKHFLVHSRTGRAFTAIRENTHAADGMGINVRWHKILAFMISAFYTGLSGALFVHLIKYISPETAQQRQSVLFVTMMLFGGTGSMLGPIIGVVVVYILMEVIRPFMEYQMLVFGVLLLIVIVALPGGLYGGMKDAIAYYKRKKMAKMIAAGKISKDGDFDA